VRPAKNSPAKSTAAPPKPWPKSTPRVGRSVLVALSYQRLSLPEDYLTPAPDVSESERTSELSVLSLEALVRMKLTYLI
ncbi:MAG: hypothetical protein ABI614_03310, partial [Planctomycetota bacterium]